MKDPRREDFLEKVRSLDGSLKKKIMIISTVIAVILVVSLWMIYFGTIVVPGPAPAPLVQATTTPEISSSGQDGTDMSGMLSVAWGSFWGSTSGFWRSLNGMLENGKQYNITPTQ
jgi:hypothetical protein